MRKIIAMLLILTLTLPLTIEALATSNGSESKKREELEKIVFIHYKRGHAKQIEAAKQERCYKFLTPTKVKWKKLPVSYVINPNNPLQTELDANLFLSAVNSAAEEWDMHTSVEILEDSQNIDYSAVAGVQDYKNVVAFGDYAEEGVIALTTVWYNPSTKSIVEFDIMFDIDWTWGNADLNNDGIADQQVMDIQNIATHEFGHAIGLGDVYSSACSEVTMYGYSDYGEVKKRTLEKPDITGLQSLYGP